LSGFLQFLTEINHKLHSFARKFNHPQNQGKKGGRKVKGENQKFCKKFLIFRTSGYQGVEHQVIWKSGY